ncbi:MAG: nitrogen fixation protein NifZ [Azoarcus sp.]|jgi:nitrogen fixation protein NifZ|nr:nitrogen fixation protein NifZ [Azoarcus sp.]
MRPRWQIDDEVRLIRDVRDDGTFPGASRGELLVRRGSVGTIRDIGSFLQDQIIYSVHFLAENRVVGCREEELIDMAEAWTPSRFAFRDKVRSRAGMAVQGELLVRAGDTGEILKVLRDPSGDPDEVAYHVHFDTRPGRIFQVPERMLDAMPQAGREPEISEEDAERYYRQHPRAFTRPEARRLRHILVTYDDAAQKERVTAQLEALRARIGSVEDFAAAALEYSQCPTAMREGLIGTVRRGQLFPELEAPAFALAEGEISLPRESPVGLHLLYCEAVLPETTVSFEEARARIIAHLAGKRGMRGQAAGIGKRMGE